MASADQARQPDAATPQRPVHNWREVITVEPAGYVEMTDAQRREAVAAFTAILGNWWQRRGGVENTTASRSTASPATEASPSAEEQ